MLNFTVTLPVVVRSVEVTLHSTGSAVATSTPLPQSTVGVAVRQKANTRPWSAGLLVPGVKYAKAGSTPKVSLPKDLVELTSPFTRGPKVVAIQKALLAAGVTPDPELVVEGDFEEQSGQAALEKLLAARVPFTAVFAGNDQMAFGAGLALLRHELRVPEDVSLVGFDDQPSAAYTWPPLTTVRQATTEMGMAAAHALLEQLRGRGFTLPAFNTDLVLRDSTAPPPRKR